MKTMWHVEYTMEQGAKRFLPKEKPFHNSVYINLVFPFGRKINQATKREYILTF